MVPILWGLLAALGLGGTSILGDLLKGYNEKTMFGMQKKFAKEMQGREAETLAMVSGRNVARQNEMLKQYQEMKNRDSAASREDQMMGFMQNQALMGQQQAGQIGQQLAGNQMPPPPNVMGLMDMLR
jgi:hypothetical protein